jgi:DNA-binding PadR family transcriptional regulator
MYGYEILKALRDEFEGLWRPETGALYPALKRLMEHGLVQVDTRDDKEYYQLTEPAQAWLRDTLRDIGPELIFASKYMEVLSHAAAEERGEVGKDAPLPWVLRHLVQDETDDEVRLAQWRQVREMMGKRLEELDKEIERLEKR